MPPWCRSSPTLPDQRSSGALVWALAILLGLAVTTVVGRLLPEGALGSWRRPVLLGAFAAVTTLAGLLVYGPLLGDRTVPLWALVLIFMVTLEIMMLARRPEELASYRLLLVGVVLAWVVALVSGGALRSTLQGMQFDAIGIGAEYRDLQIASGVLLAWAGGLFAFAGAVGLWARRRDELEEHSRAGQQLAVAAISAAELEQAI